MKEAIPILAGLVIAAIGEFIGLMLSGGGHGWTEPFFYSLLMFLGWPIALDRMPRPDGTSARSDTGMLALGAVATVLLLVQTASYPAHFWWLAQQNGYIPVVVAWLPFWFGWQALTLVNICRTR